MSKLYKLRAQPSYKGRYEDYVVTVPKEIVGKIGSTVKFEIYESGGAVILKTQ